MIEKRWIGFVAGRYISRGQAISPQTVFSVLGIATGVLALIIIIAVMNGFQLGFIESILEISSFHIRIEGLETKEDPELINRLGSLSEVLSVLPFEEQNVLLRGYNQNPRGVLLRGVPPNALELDPGLKAKLEIQDGFFDLHDPRNIVLGSELARHLQVMSGDEVNLLSISGGFGSLENEANNIFNVSGIFCSNFYEFDLGWAFLNMEAASELLIPAEPDDLDSNLRIAPPAILGIKLKNRWQDQKALRAIENFLANYGLPESILNGVTIKSWRDYNRSFFGALRTEKLMMFILVGLIFIVVGLNIFQAQRRIILERQEEIGILRALGATIPSVRLVFIWDGFVIGFAGAVLGLVPGLLIAFNMQAFFSFLEGAVNFFINLINMIMAILGQNVEGDEFAFFSTQIFYIKEIPSRVIPHEVLLIFMFGFLSAILAAWFASGKVSAAIPTEVLRNE